VKTIVRLGKATTDLVERITLGRFLALRELGGATGQDVSPTASEASRVVPLDAVARIRPGSRGR